MRYRFTKYLGDDLDGLDIEELFAQISDLLLASGFRHPYAFDETEQTLQALHDAVLDAVLHGGLLPQETLDRLLGDEADAEGRARLEQLVQQIIERLQTQGYIAPAPDRTAERREGTVGGRGPDLPPVRFEVTDKGLDFLGYRALRDLLGSLGKSSVGRHDTRDLATGVEAGGPAKPYEFGDTLNLDASATILHAVERGLAAGAAAAAAPIGRAALDRPRSDPGEAAQGPFEPIDVQYEDLMVSQGEFQSSCATVLLLDCSHSMILYGEDRFTPAKRVALALASLIRSQYPGDSLQVVLFHDSAEEIPLRQLARVRVGPYYTNTREGLRLARRLLERQRRDMRQIIMITDGKPSATTRPDGRVYRNAFGLDPFIVTETFAEVAACRRAGIMINTFMLARDYDLVAFVRKVAEICRGKAYFTTPYTLGQYVLMDYLNKKTRTIH
ncbi:MAG TPA: VWA domain-containing protein [Vicinamibacterales bacterium]|nr:VWA domain-containing protein [Vicinamibacterales bacterium]